MAGSKREELDRDVAVLVKACGVSAVLESMVRYCVLQREAAALGFGISNFTREDLRELATKYSLEANVLGRVASTLRIRHEVPPTRGSYNPVK